MKAMRDYFKSEADFYEFVILRMDGEQRTNILGITVRHYRDKELAAEWARDILSKISDEDAIRRIMYIYRRMVGDMNAELPTKTEEPKEAPKMMENPVVYMIHNGEEALREQLETMSYEELKELIKTYHLDTSRSYSRSKKPERLRQGIMARAITRATQGETFFNYGKENT